MFPDTSNIAWKPDTRQRQLVKVEWSTMGPHRKIRTRVPNGTSSKLVGGVQSQSGPEFEQYNDTKYNHKPFPHVYSTRTATRNEPLNLRVWVTGVTPNPRVRCTFFGVSVGYHNWACVFVTNSHSEEDIYIYINTGNIWGVSGGCRHLWGSNELFANRIIRGTFRVGCRVAVRVEYT
jgi:hypothetical protein